MANRSPKGQIRAFPMHEDVRDRGHVFVKHVSSLASVSVRYSARRLSNLHDGSNSDL